MTDTAAFLCGLSLGAALTGAKAARSAALAKATRDMRDRQRAYFKHRGDVLLAEAKTAEAAETACWLKFSQSPNRDNSSSVWRSKMGESCSSSNTSQCLQEGRTERFLRLPEVMSRVGLKKTAIYSRIKTGRFPKPTPLTARNVAWPESQIDNLIEKIKAGEFVL